MMISQTAVLNSHRLDVGSTLNSKTVSHNARGATSRVDATASHVVVCHTQLTRYVGPSGQCGAEGTIAPQLRAYPRAPNEKRPAGRGQSS